jgi:phosphoribosylaminoimidazole synthetase
MTKILILGSGCREFAIVNKLLRDDENLIIHYADAKRNQLLSRLAKFIDIYYIKTEYIEYDVIIAGPEKYCGMFLSKLNYNPETTMVWGAKDGNEYLEFSKIFTRRFVHSYCSDKDLLPNPVYYIHKNINNMLEGDIKKEEQKLHEEFNYLTNINKNNGNARSGIVIKPDGLTGGKGVKLYPDHFNELSDIIQYIKEIDCDYIVEQKLEGREFSYMAFCDGESLSFMPPVQDYKRAYAGDIGPNTGSMGSICFGGDYNNLIFLEDDTKWDAGLYFLNKDDLSQCQTIMKNTIQLLKYNESHLITSEYCGVLYGSFMKTLDGQIKLIEYNVRFGDPECINVMEILDTPLLDIITACCNKELSSLDIVWKNKVNTVFYLTPYDYPDPNIVTRPIDFPEPNQSFFTNVVHNNIYKNSTFKHTNGVTFSDSTIITYYTNDMIGKPPSVIHLMPNKSRTACFCITSSNMEELYNDCRKLYQYLDFHINGYHMNYTVRYRSDILDTYNHNRGQFIYAEQGGIDTQEIGNVLVSAKEMIASTYNTIDNNSSVNDGNAGNTGNGNNSIQGQVTSSFGSFGGEYLLPDGRHTLVASTDGVGTKTIALREAFGISAATEIAGQDIVNHNINDILVNGGVPLFFLDYFGCAQFNKKEFNGLIKGITTSCRKYGVALLGGETAVMRDVYRNGEIDIVGTIIGRKEFTFYRQYVPGEDVLVGLDASGFHTNGFSFLRKNWHPDFKKGMVEPHRCYLNEIRDLVYSGVSIKALSHITGGGFYDNLNRVIPRENYKLNLDDIILPDYYTPILDAGYTKMDCMEMLNCGVGMVMIININDYQKVKTKCIDACIIGHVI